jgi:hypothetical protein
MRLNELPLDCLGHKRCPKGPNNSNRQFCRFYDTCLDRLIERGLEKGKSITSIRMILQSVSSNISDFFLLRRIGRIALENGYKFGRKAVDSAIEKSEIKDDCEPLLEASEVRRAFGVYGRGSEPAKSMSLGLTVDQNFKTNAFSEMGPTSTSERIEDEAETTSRAWVSRGGNT